MRSFRLGDCVIDLDAATVSNRQRVSTLSPNEMRLLRYLAERAGEIVPRSEILTEVWGYRPGSVSRTIDTTTMRLREKLGPEDAQFLHAIYGQGLRLDGVTPLETARAPTDALYGRAAEIEQCQDAIRAKQRVVTLAGIGGVGKSRLAAEVSARFPALRTLNIDVSQVKSSDDLDVLLLDALSVTDPGPLRLALDRALLMNGALLIVLDECEGALEAVRSCSQRWLLASPRLQILATSRIPLGIPAERLISLGPLEPNASRQLFVERVHRIEPDLTLDLAVVASITAAVDHLPLAITLAAAQAPRLGLKTLCDLLQQPLDVLRTAKESMAQTLERSFQQLPNETRRVLTACAVFEGSFAPRDLAALLQDTHSRESHLQFLVSCSLLQEHDQTFTMFHIVRQRARADLQPQDPLWEAHARWFSRLGDPDELDRQRCSPDLFFRLVEASADLRAAMERTRTSSPEIAARCGLALLWPAGVLTHWSAGFKIATLLEEIPCSARVRSKIAIQLGFLCARATDHERAIALLEEELQRCVHPADRVDLCVELWHNRRQQGDLCAAEALSRAEPDLAKSGAAQCRWWFSWAILTPGDQSQTERRLRDSLRVARQFGHRNTEITSLIWSVIYVHMPRGEFDTSLALLREAETLSGADEIRAHHLTHIGLIRGMLYFELGDLDTAEPLFAAALDDALRLGMHNNASLYRVMLGEVALLRGDLEEAMEIAEYTALDQVSEPIRGVVSILKSEIYLLRGEQERAANLMSSLLESIRDRGWTQLEADALVSVSDTMDKLGFRPASKGRYWLRCAAQSLGTELLKTDPI